MTTKSIGGGIYVSDEGGYYIRPFVNGKRTWRKLASQTAKFAREEAAALKSDQARAVLGLAKDPFRSDHNAAALIDLYLKANCPDKRLKGRPAKFCKREEYHLEWIKKYFGDRDPQTIRIDDCHNYAEWRKPQMKKGSGNRQCEMELTSFSSVLSYAVAKRLTEFNYIKHDRPPFCEESEIRHCRDVAPEDGDELNRIAEDLFDDPRSEVLGWQMLFQAMTGCRKMEVAIWRMDAEDKNTPGYTDAQYIHLKRAKRGVNPFVVIHPDLAELIEAHHRWHAARERFTNSPWWFPGRPASQHVNASALSHALERVTDNLDLPHRTSHGMRSFYVTMRRSQGISDAQIAAEIGDKTGASIISQTYGDLPPNWQGKAGLSWRPSTGQPAWARWLGNGEPEPQIEEPLSAVAV